jgi:hypothetical protein
MEYFNVVKWSEYQHYKTRNPSWIKLSTSIFDDHHYGSLPDATKALWISVLILASKTRNRIPYDPDWIAQRCCLKERPNLQPLFDSGLIAPCKHDASIVQAFGNSLGIQKERKKERENDQKVVRKPGLGNFLREGIKRVTP